MVEAPSNLLFSFKFLKFFINALKIPFASTPGWLKSFCPRLIKMSL